jgi:hypothetical protein
VAFRVQRENKDEVLEDVMPDEDIDLIFSLTVNIQLLNLNNFITIGGNQ